VSHQTEELWEFISSWLPRPPARVLDVGCGDGASTRRLRAMGFDATGLDPEAPSERGFRRGRLEELEASAPFDAALAIRSLHHLGDADLALERLAGALRPHARLVVFEFAVEAVDDVARGWLAGQGLPPPIGERWVHEVLPLATLREVLTKRFRELVIEPAPYHAREAGRPELEPLEQAAIAAGRLRPAGARIAYEQK
jgi:ubiquinone/menaquinone biosynthesis C-methylase UbiE